MKLPVLAALLALPLAACTVERPVESTTIVSSVTPEQRQACVSAAARARSVDEALVTTLGASATPTGPVVDLSVAGAPASCKLDELGEVENVTFAS